MHIMTYYIVCFHPYVRPQQVCLISMKFGMYIEVDE